MLAVVLVLALSTWLMLRACRPKATPSQVSALVEKYGEAMRGVARERIRARTLVGPEREVRAAAKIEALRRVLHARVMLETAEQAEQAVFDEDARAEVDRELNR